MNRFLLCVTLFSSSLAHAELPNVSLSVGAQTQVVTGRDFDLVGNDDHFMRLRLGAAYALHPPVGRLDLEAAYVDGLKSSTLHQAMKAQLGLRGFEVGALYRYPLHRHLEPYARLGTGYDWGVLVVGEGRLEETVANPFGSALFGAQLPMQLADRGTKDPSVVFDLGVGYTLRPEYAFHRLTPKTASPLPPDSVPNQAVDFGSLGLSGITYRLQLALRI